MSEPLRFGLRNPRTGELSALRPHQHTYWLNRRKYRYVLNGGDWSSGKTAANLYCVAEDVTDALRLGVHQKRGQPYAVVLIHKKLDWSRTALLEPLKAILPSETPAGISLWFRLPGDENRFRYGTKRNHVLFDWIGLDPTAVDPAEFKRSSKNYDLACVSQGDILREEVLWAIDARLGRFPLPAPLVAQQLWDSNATKNFVYRIFLKRQVENPERFYCQLSDIESMGDLLSESFRKVMSERPEWQKKAALDWDYAPGQAFLEYDPRASWLLFDQIPFEASWKLKEATDWGFRIDPAFWLWYCVDHSGNIWFLDELELYDHNAPQQAAELLCKREQLICEIAAKVGNPSTDQRRMCAGSYGAPDLNQQESGIGKTKGEQLRDAGVNIVIVNPDVPGAWEKAESKLTALASALRVDPNRRHPLSGELGSPRVFISSRCERLAEQISTAMIDPDNPKRLDKTRVTNRFADGHTHHWDAVDAAYIALQEQTAPRRPLEHKRITTPPNQMRDYELARAMRETDNERY